MSFAAVAIGVGAVGSIAGAAISANAGKSAAKTASQTADKNNALQESIYNQNATTLAPYVQAGNNATNSIQALLGIGGGYTQPQGTVNTPALGVGAGAGSRPREDFKVSDGFVGVFDALLRRNIPGYGQANETQAQATYGPAVTQQSANDAFAQYRNSTGYDFRTGEGNKALTASLGRNSMLDSGAAVKSAIKYNQNVASDEFSRYLSMLERQQAVGLSGASAQAGVGQGYANSVSQNNNNAANAAGNAAINTGNQVNQALGGLVSSAGTAAGLRSSYNRQQDWEWGIDRNPGGPFNGGIVPGYGG